MASAMARAFVRSGVCAQAAITLADPVEDTRQRLEAEGFKTTAKNEDVNANCAPPTHTEATKNFFKHRNRSALKAPAGQFPGGCVDLRWRRLCSFYISFKTPQIPFGCVLLTIRSTAFERNVFNRRRKTRNGR
eukprot:GHVT01023051.1.p1 GENE.GHVT01023051.1~~GHVT01023051.1.p1  ORF type:complete len:133 (-),score=19.43 GHVT01023051.1:338-736(-)